MINTIPICLITIYVTFTGFGNTNEIDIEFRI